MARHLISGSLEQLKDMAGQMISGVLGQSGSAAHELTKEEVKAVKDVEEEIEKLSSELTAIQAVLYNAEKRQYKDANVKDWLDKLNDVSHDIDDVLDEWITAIKKSDHMEKEEKEGDQDAPPAKKVCLSLSLASSWIFNFPLLELVHRHKIASRIKALNERLNAIAVEKSRYMFSVTCDTELPKRSRTTSFVDLSDVYGRDREKEVLVHKLCESSQDGRRLDIIPIIGMGGIGKTTLGLLAYHDDRVKASFEKRIWVCVSQPFDEISIARSIIESLGGRAAGLVELESLLQHIHEMIEGKRFLLVLDDVWAIDATKWESLKESLKSGAPESRILVTTRKKDIAMMMTAENNIISMKLLTDEICWSIFSQLAFFGRDRCTELEEIGKQIAIKCRGLPLVAKTLGSLMRYKTCIQQWKDILESEIWELEKDIEKNEVFAPFLLSYNDLSSVEKRCLSYCSIFPKDYEMYKDDLIQLWISQGYINGNKNMEKEGRDCFENLAMRSFFQNFQKDQTGNIISCKMHDIMHDFIHSLAKIECVFIDVEKKEYTGKKIRHATLLVGSVRAVTNTITSSLYENKGLRTLFVASSSTWSANALSLRTLFSKLKCLRTLNLSNGSFQELPDKIEELIHLRYLDLSRTFLKELPNSVCNLFNLQILRVNDCFNLERLPKEIGKLINLCHLYIDGCGRLHQLPKGIAKLSSLQTLDMFVVHDNDYPMDNETLDLEDLNMLKLPQCFLRIRGCGNLENGDQAEMAQLKDKEYLVELGLDFNSTNENRQGAHDEILDALEPHPNLKSLCISDYLGSTISPNWMMALVNLKSLTLWSCLKCEVLPPLGKLPSLESLNLITFFRVEKVGVEFLGIESDDVGAPRRHQLSFPKLKQLGLFHLPEWKEWEWTIWGEVEDDCLTIMPFLESLVIEDCKRLTALPGFLENIPLQHLLIQDCPILKERCREGVGEDWPKISHIPNTQLQNSWAGSL